MNDMGRFLIRWKEY